MSKIKTYEFVIKGIGKGETVEEAWDNCVEGLELEHCSAEDVFGYSVVEVETTIKAYLIDPVSCTLTKIDIQKDAEIAKLIECEWFEGHNVNKYGDVLYVDEEGRMKSKIAFWMFDETTFVNKGIIIGTTKGGAALCDPKATFDEVYKRITF